MKTLKKGFTLIEVLLFLAVTGLLFLGVTLGVQNSIYQQRYNDMVQGFANFLRNIYDEVLNVQSLSNGRHEKAIYGKMVSFGEKNEENKQVVYVYDVIGGVTNSADNGSGTTLKLLKDLKADVVFRESVDQPYKPVGIIEAYTPNWGARIQNVDNYNDYKGVLLIVRDPRSGVVRTFVGVGDDNDVIEVNEAVDSIPNVAFGQDEEPLHVLTNYLTMENFRPKQVDFCINPEGTNPSNRRADVRLAESAMNSSGVEVISLDVGDNKCNE